MTIIVSGQAAGAGHWSYKQLSTFPVIKNLAHLARKRLRREGLLEKRHAWVQLPMMAYSLVGVARHKEHLHVWTRWPQTFRQLAPAHLRHHHIGNHQMDQSLVLPGETQGVFPLRRFQHRVSPGLEDCLR